MEIYNSDISNYFMRIEHLNYKLYLMFLSIDKKEINKNVKKKKK